MSTIQVKGDVAPGFESVKDLFSSRTRALAEDNVQLCVYHRGKRIVDLWASAGDDEAFTADSLVNVFSSGKSLEAIILGMLTSRDLIEYDANIVQYWPEFGANGKENITVADLMRHEAGLANFDTSLDAEDLFTENIKRNVVGRVIETQRQKFKRRDRREYHTVTRGWVVNEIVRRVDPAGRTIGEILREEISEPLRADVYIGVQSQERQRMRPVKPLSFRYQILQSLLPQFLGRRVTHNFFQLIARMFALLPAILQSWRGDKPPPAMSNVTRLDDVNIPEFGKGETPSANATCSARGLARVGAMMSARGTLEGHRLLTERAWHAMHAANAGDDGCSLAHTFHPGRC
ncbi:MAG: serine hydrolase domain-containing protein [Pseudomonadota bacterium]